jgi:hypothetical protein
MGPEMVDMFPYNAGIMLANLPALRESYKPFLEFILSNKYGLTFPGFGPGDQVGRGCGVIGRNKHMRLGAGRARVCVRRLCGVDGGGCGA